MARATLTDVSVDGSRIIFGPDRNIHFFEFGSMIEESVTFNGKLLIRAGRRCYIVRFDGTGPEESNVIYNVRVEEAYQLNDP